MRFATKDHIAPWATRLNTGQPGYEFNLPAARRAVRLAPASFKVNGSSKAQMLPEIAISLFAHGPFILKCGAWY